ncbi:hypothetical protein N665_0858s0022 [Sinapis alba]|nr:hypothetical protein N665_0858s0022 [Sinapis alba]
MKPGMTTQSFGWRAEQSSSVSFVDSSGLKQNSRPSSSVAKFRRQNSCTIEFSFGSNHQEGEKKNLTDELSLDGFKISNDHEGVEAKITLALGHSPFPSDDEEEPERSTTMRELSEKLHENIPWQKEVLPSVVGAMEESVKRSKRRDAWMLLLGNDVSAKRILALTITTSLFGSVDNMLKINLRTSKASEACEELEKALKDREKVLVLIERVDLAYDRFMKLLVDRFEAGKSGDLDDSQGKKSHMIFLLTREDDECEDNEHVVIPMVLKCKKSSSGLVNNKRKPESEAAWTMIKMKNPRIQEEEACDISNIKKEFSRQLNFRSNELDLNLRVDAEEEEEEASAKSATQESFLDSIKNRFDFTVLSNEDLTKFFVAKIKDSCEEILGQHEERFGFTVEPELIEKFYRGCGFFANGLFEEWVKDVFQTGLVTVKNGGKEGISVINLCLRGIDMIDQGEVYEEEGFMGTCLPNTIQVSFVD